MPHPGASGRRLLAPLAAAGPPPVRPFRGAGGRCAQEQARVRWVAGSSCGQRTAEALRCRSAMISGATARGNRQAVEATCGLSNNVRPIPCRSACVRFRQVPFSQHASIFFQSGPGTPLLPAGGAHKPSSAWALNVPSAWRELSERGPHAVVPQAGLVVTILFGMLDDRTAELSGIQGEISPDSRAAARRWMVSSTARHAPAATGWTGAWACRTATARKRTRVWRSTSPRSPSRGAD